MGHGIAVVISRGLLQGLVVQPTASRAARIDLTFGVGHGGPFPGSSLKVLWPPRGRRLDAQSGSSLSSTVLTQ